MRDLVELVFEYRRLRARSHLGISLSEEHIAQLAALERLFGKESAEHKRRQFARCPVEMTATVESREGTEHPVKLTCLGGGGVRVTPAPSIPQGQSAILKISANDAHYQYRVRAGWRGQDESETSMGMRFVGTPSKLAS